MIAEIESNWRETGIKCKCGEMTYSDGKSRPRCCECLAELTNETIWEWLTRIESECAYTNF